MKTKIMGCRCEHEYQDKRYGKGMRVFNFATNAQELKGAEGWRCTVCLHTVPN
jgi:hypothetical protein